MGTKIRYRAHSQGADNPQYRLFSSTIGHLDTYYSLIYPLKKILSHTNIWIMNKERRNVALRLQISFFFEKL
jgi:hypothetical protein